MKHSLNFVTVKVTQTSLKLPKSFRSKSNVTQQDTPLNNPKKQPTFPTSWKKNKHTIHQLWKCKSIFLRRKKRSSNQFRHPSSARSEVNEPKKPKCCKIPRESPNSLSEPHPCEIRVFDASVFQNHCAHITHTTRQFSASTQWIPH